MENTSLVDSEFITFKNSQGLSARGTLLKISQNHIVFETYNPYSIVQLSEVLNNVTICRFSEAVYVGKAVVSNLINTGLLLIVSATLVDPWSEKIRSSHLEKVQEITQKFIEEWRQLDEAVLPGYQLSINKIRSFLSDLNRWVRQIDNTNSQSDLRQSQEELLSKIEGKVSDSLGELIHKFELEVKKVNAPQVGVCKRFTQQELHPLMMQAPFGHRVFNKPLGYAGDYEMVNMMLRNPYEGETTYAKLLNIFLLKTGPAEAHRNRIDILFDKIKKIAIRASEQNRRAQIFNFACGPAAEIQRFVELEPISENCDFVLLDFNKETLEYTESILQKIKNKSGHKGVGIKLVHKSVNDVLRSAIGLRESNSEDLKDFDFIYCAGLFDYLSDRVCSKLLNLFLSQLSKDGELMATNVHINNPVRGMMEHIFEWYLIYRDETGFLNLINAKDKKVYADKTGFNIFLEAKSSLSLNERIS